MLSVTRAFASNQTRILSSALLRTYSSSEVPKYETLAVSVPKEFVYHVELNRPNKLNAFNNTMWMELKDCFSSLSDNSACRVVVISAQGKMFTAGIDLNSLVELGRLSAEIEDVARKARFFHGFIKKYQDSLTSLETCVKPVLSVVHGACIGAGIDLITASDIRYCSADAWFSVREVDAGLAADVGTLQRLPKVIGSASIARELCFTARKVDSKEALDIGLVSKVFPDKDTAIKEVLQVAASIASKSPVAVQTTKQNMVYSQSRPNQDGLDHIRWLNQAMLQSEDLTKSAVAQFSKGEPPEFDNL